MTKDDTTDKSVSHIEMNTVSDMYTGNILDRSVSYSMIDVDNKPYSIFHTLRDGYGSFMDKMSEIPTRLFSYFDGVYKTLFHVGFDRPASQSDRSTADIYDRYLKPKDWIRSD